jgi:hypothetical protein
MESSAPLAVAAVAAAALYLSCSCVEWRGEKGWGSY